MASRRSYDTDEITLRRVFAKSTGNIPIPALRVLTADGQGGTYWTIPSTNGAWNPSFNRVVTNAGTFTADLSFNTLQFSEGTGIGFSAGSNTNQLFFYGKSFGQIDVSGNNSIAAFSNYTLNPTVKFAATGNVQLRADNVRNIIYFDGTGSGSTSTGSSLYSFQKAFVLSNTSTITGNISSLAGEFLNADSASSVLKFVGLGDVNLTSDYLNNAIYFGINQSTGTVSSLSALVNANYSTISSLYTLKSDFSTATTNLSTTSWSNFSTSFGFTSNVSITVFNLPFNQYTTLSQFNFTKTILETGISTVSTAASYTPALYSTSAGLQLLFSSIISISTLSSITLIGGTLGGFTANTVNVYPGDLSTLSTNVGDSLNSQSTFIGYTMTGLSTLSTTIGSVSNLLPAGGVIGVDSLISSQKGLGTYGYLSTISLFSTLNGLGTLQFVSTPSLISTVEGLGSADYISSASLTSTVTGLGLVGYVSSLSLTSTSDGLGTLGYISTTSFFSSLEGLGSLGYLSTLSTIYLSTGATSASSFILLDTVTGKPSFLNVINGSLNLDGSNVQGSGSGTIFLSTNFTSSIFNYGIVNSTITMTNSPQYNFFFSTAVVKLDPFSSFINSKTDIYLDFQYNYIFDTWQYASIASNSFSFTNLMRFSTGLVYGPNTFDLDSFQQDSLSCLTSNTTSYFDPIFMGTRDKPTANSNTLTRFQRFKLPTSNVQNSYLSTVSLYHFLHNALWYPGLFTSVPVPFWLVGSSGLSSGLVQVNMTPTSTAFLSIYNGNSYT